MYEMLVGYPPFYSDEPMSTCRKSHAILPFPSSELLEWYQQFSIVASSILSIYICWKTQFGNSKLAYTFKISRGGKTIT
nr:serine/threonine-protein kinase tricorner-like isoform X2 [Ipomoea batatas]